MLSRQLLLSFPSHCLVTFLLATIARFTVAQPESTQASQPSPESSGAARKTIDFAHDVLPLLKAHCVKCHTGEEPEGEFSMATREALLTAGVVAPGKSGESELIKRVTSKDPDEQMPPEGERLSEKQVEILRRWIDEGLPWQEGFAFGKPAYVAPLVPRRPELPPVQAGRDNPVDRLIDAYFAEHKIERPALVGDETFLRRVYLDVIGLLPAPEQREAFLNDTSPDKREQLVQKLLADDRAYAEHWLTFWNDLLRNDYAGTGYIDGGREQITGWLYPALLTNKPYDQFVRELINPRPEAAGFIKGIKWRGRVNASQTPEIQFAQNISQVFLGINMKCASCHDSFIDDWKLDDAYGLAAIIADKPLEIFRCDQPTGQTAHAKFVFPELGELDPALSREERLALLAELITNAKNGRLARTIVNRIWHRLVGRGIVHPVDALGNAPWNRDLLDYLGVHLAENEYDLKKTIELIVTSQTYQSQTVALPGETSADEYVYRGPLAKRLTAEQFVDAIWRITGTVPSQPAAKFGDRGGESVRAALVNSDVLMRSLGRPNREQVVTTRPDDLSTLVALDLTNGAALADLLDRGAKNICKRHSEWDTGELTHWLYRIALCREPTAEELVVAMQVVGEPLTDERVADLLWTVFMLPEFQLVK
ncbi:MAG: PSD1 and planctomycete cytochrome C domain-containing protein [Pirellulales bacterium]